MDSVGTGYNCPIIKFYVGFPEIGEYNFHRDNAKHIQLSVTLPL